MPPHETEPTQEQLTPVPPEIAAAVTSEITVGLTGATVHAGATTGEKETSPPATEPAAENSEPEASGAADKATKAPAAPSKRKNSAAKSEHPKKKEGAAAAERAVTPSSILVVDIGGTKVKILATGQTEPRKAPTGKEFSPARLVETVRGLAHDWQYDAISLGFPGSVGTHGPRSEPGNLGPGWVGFDFAAAFGMPVKMVNDAVMQALGSYEGGRMLFLGLGTGLGSALITGHVVVPLELGQLLCEDKRTLGRVLGRRGFDRLGRSKWRAAVMEWVTALMHSFMADYVVIGGGNAKHVKDLPPGARRGHNLTAFRGGFRLWSAEDIWVLATPGGESPQPTEQEAVKVL